MVNTKRQLHRLQNSIKQETLKVKAKEEKELTISEEIQRLNDLLAAKQKANISSQKNLLKQEGFLREKQLELNLCQKGKSEAEEHIKNRLKAFYQTGEISIINALFSSSTLPDLINTKEYFRAILRNDRQTIKSYKKQLTTLNTDRDLIISGKRELLKNIRAIKEREKELITVHQKRQELLKKIQSEKDLYQHALREMKHSAKLIGSKLKRYKSTPTLHPQGRKIRVGAPDRQGPVYQTKSFLDFKGHLPSPLKRGRVITKFGKVKGVFGNTFQSSGIDILPRAQAAIVSTIYAGKVVFSGTMDGYGNTVIIAHEDNYFTLYSNLTTITTKRGRGVSRGEKIGRVEQTTDSILNTGLHLEIRKGAVPEDPLLWLDNSKFNM